MADFPTLVAEVGTITNRPDLVAETTLAVKSATLQLHRTDFYFKDLVEQAIVYDTANYLQSINYRTLFPRYRSLKYLRKLDSSGANPSTFFEVILPEEILDGYKLQRQDVCYVAGEVIQVNSSTPDTYALIGVYVLPTIDTPTTYNSWIATESEYAIVYQAAALVFGMLSNDTAKNTYLQMAADEMAMIKQDNIQARGY